ncbi:hypothetical protein VTJ49DRAFT_3377 [Mycothermus thermophilus]|uniref:Uncharacterized protein n=1 Tax=Humicola insolens TaxID=85995 RepID=A0ABR3V8B9_HUMIN
MDGCARGKALLGLCPALSGFQVVSPHLTIPTVVHPTAQIPALAGWLLPPGTGFAFRDFHLVPPALSPCFLVTCSRPPCPWSVLPDLLPIPTTPHPKSKKKSVFCFFLVFLPFLPLHHPHISVGLVCSVFFPFSAIFSTSILLRCFFAVLVSHLAWCCFPQSSQTAV